MTSNNTSNTALSASEIEEIRSAFELFDVKNTGRIAISDLSEILREIAVPSAKQLLDRLQRQEQDSISLDEFTTLLTTPHPNDFRDGLQQVFDLFDTQQKGYITIDDLQKVAKELGEEPSESFLKKMLGDKDQVSPDEFREIMAGKPPKSS